MIREFHYQVLTLPEESRTYRHCGRNHAISENFPRNYSETISGAIDFFGFRDGNRGLDEDGFLRSPINDPEGQFISDLFYKEYGELEFSLNDGFQFIRNKIGALDINLFNKPSYFSDDSCVGVLPLKINWEFVNVRDDTFSISESYKLFVGCHKSSNKYSLHVPLKTAERDSGFDWLEKECCSGKC